MMLTDRNRISYQAWGVSLMLHGLLLGGAAMVSVHVGSVIKEELFQWEVSLVEPARDPALPVPAPVVTQPTLTTPVNTRRAALDPSSVPAPVIEPAKPVEPQDARPAVVAQEVALSREAAKPTPLPEAVQPPTPIHQTVVQPEPVVHESHPAPKVKEVALPVDTNLSASPDAPAVPTGTHHAAASAVIHEESPSPEDMAPAWRPLVSAGEAKGQLAPEPTAASVTSAVVERSAYVTAAAQTVASATPQFATGEPVRSATKADNTWLAESLGRRIRELTRYPSSARLNGWEGKVVLRVIIRADGHLAEATVHRSSGHEVLDRAALETIRLACPLHMKQTLSAEQVAVYVPIVYSLAG